MRTTAKPQASSGHIRPHSKFARNEARGDMRGCEACPSASACRLMSSGLYMPLYAFIVRLSRNISESSMVVVQKHPPHWHHWCFLKHRVPGCGKESRKGIENGTPLSPQSHVKKPCLHFFTNGRSSLAMSSFLFVYGSKSPAGAHSWAIFLKQRSQCQKG